MPAAPFQPAPSAASPSGFVLAGMHGSSGKTVLTCLVLAGLRARGLSLQPFKAGPDYIDPGFHAVFSESPSRNLDLWLMGEAACQSDASAHTRCATGVLEGVMGLFDGASPTSNEGSTLELARLLGWPVVLCVPAAKAGRSIAASLRGFLAEAHPTTIAGVVLNGVSGSSHTEYLKEAICPLGVPVLGALPHCPELQWPERHLGLQAAPEQMLPSLADLAAIALRHLDLDAFASFATRHSASKESPVLPKTNTPDQGSSPKHIAIARDAAFHFYYQSDLDWLRAQGATLTPFSPLSSTSLPAGTDALLLGGGFPEVYAEQISGNKPLLTQIRAAVADGLPCYAECGGLMLLAQALRTRDARSFPMAGCLPGEVLMTDSLQHFGYCTAARPGGSPHRGHEFHYSKWTQEASAANAWQVTRRRTSASRTEGFRMRNLHASYVHLSFSSNSTTLRAQLGFDS